MRIRVALVAIFVLGECLAPAAQPRVLVPGDSFNECDGCPEMVVMPKGKFIMGSPKDEPGSMWWWESQHRVLVAGPFAIGRFAITVDQFDS
jgi:formylglycine-generating enzyme required for sulfatase activity